MEKKIFWAGDSTVAKNSILSYPQTGIGQVMELYLCENVRVYNFAKNGRSSKSFYKEGILNNISKELSKDDFLFIQFGHNDEKEDEERRTEPFSTYQQYLNIYIDTALKKQAYPVLITPLYRRFFEADGQIKENVHFDFPSAMIQLGEKRNIPVIDLCQKSKELLVAAGDDQSKKWFMHLEQNEFSSHPDGLKDNTHLKYDGAVVMAGLVAEGLKQLNGIYRELLIL